MLDVSIIIVNWNAQDLLAKCMRCVQDTVHEASYEIIVIDNASTDGSQVMVKQDFPDVVLIENKDNVGFAGANNQGMKIAQGRYVLLLNSDAFVEAKTIDAMVAFMDAHPEAGMGACKLLYEDRSLQPSCYGFPTLKSEFYVALQLDKLFPKSPEFGQFLMTFWDFNDVRAVDVVMGAFMLVRREALDAVGMMDDSYFMYSEEVDWCYRFQKAGWKTLYNPAVQTVHLWGGSSKRVRVEMFLQMHRSKIEFFRKNYGSLSALGLKGIMAFGALLRVGPGALVYLTSSDPDKRQKHEAFRRLLTALPAY
ncbi:MAG: glycosyltransferase family 2 protein [Anaerolineae bacterium]|nr:glycosyltransferase family 2 protein [Anaerolineae bacterium]